MVQQKKLFRKHLRNRFIKLPQKQNDNSKGKIEDRAFRLLLQVPIRPCYASSQMYKALPIKGLLGRPQKRLLYSREDNQ
ncbi:hypothetical protein J0S82_020933 [Galemys pyrenaicus]|uniref:Uncharacterized protein n=1 Tax=Galemys pyrenaicus TaxID=202257 RepID=A0A8J6DLY1_GALPY|nr:hypothetical protein J0S82_020933 [Galemys pyrenaicus]